MMINIPNLLTAFRIVLIPFFVLAFYLPVEWGMLAAAFIFGLAAATDYLDGYLARRLGQTTPFGAFLDPVADKAMVVAALVLLVEHYQTFWITVPAVIMISREIIISALREWMAELGKRSSVAVSWIGKYKTAAQMAAITGLTAQIDPLVTQASYGLFYVATILTLWSMVSYLMLAWPQLKQNG
ncbi:MULTISPECIES: CDP-diacylglycerol--glycerol-3-phosphate 3-phosphatidyltransferase [unclassified Agarivorans]|uniref:CDP-diacylglycerol--glycerol-3-phosphate 3-phosphatidyltransferase n=1 Tax=unclassified Agarivorans TaxID=2636026 RepID=UPI00191E2F91|nr:MULTISPECIES: CDP-diacylglycerol--glycerol-3-phosphate 3-phosphatidyltransferase [unclassified Agarivorans]MDO6684997.1 CDP-diacylglycerol--glycerol-3-phosphate 3-phosphatidyltransferase [Agarivorans sp. 3_MG-2023]MDO6714842.1 CDP-diacylglycerol--glycerol-3-phosphate 3-phosphatidyltransferase [Agarivorans sp. 2_MG-2023]MDO6765357.1 CDP-diacylglycerol--glycerol-3-phosphate 3-phosphatidyltransferase [Agarivorans sp. 1_MG-2023]